MNAAAWMNKLSLNSSADDEARRQDADRRTATQSKVMVVDRWNGTAWEQHTLVWDGGKYVPETVAK